MIETIYLLSFIIFLLGLSGSVIPGLPGPLITYLGLSLLYGATEIPISGSMMLLLGFFMAVSTIGDYVLQVLGVKKLGGGKNAIRGTIIGTIIGLFVPPLGIILGALLGAFIGASSETDSDAKALKITFGAFIGFVLGTLLKLVYSMYVVYYIITLL